MLVVDRIDLPDVGDLHTAVADGRLEAYVAELPAVFNLAARGGLRLTKPVTVVTGDNGSGKSTLLEAIALKLGFDAFGGPRHGFDGRTARLRTGTESALSRLLRVSVRGADIAGGFYLRAETQMDLIRAADSPIGKGTRTYLEHEVGSRSHGESVIDLVGEYVRGGGIYLLDEPESGLSVIRQMALLAEIHQAAELGAQFIVATHSPILPAIPGADVVEVSEAGIMSVGYEALESVRATREFLDDPVGVARYLTS